MKTTKTCKEYRLDAHNLFETQSNNLVKVFGIYFLISIVLGLTGIGSIVTLLLSGGFSLSFAYISKKVYNNETTVVDDLFYGLKDFGKGLALYLLTFLYSFLWSLLFIIPGIVKAISYSMAFFIQNDNPDYTASQCIDESKRIMEGHKMDYFLLTLSYLGWLILSVFTFGILLLWIMPKMNLAFYLFYLDITGQPNNSVDCEDHSDYNEEIHIVYNE